MALDPMGKMQPICSVPSFKHQFVNSKETLNSHIRLTVEIGTDFSQKGTGQLKVLEQKEGPKLVHLYPFSVSMWQKN